ncbi:hypothetical protein B0H16DRAFT_1826177 [Mycena metata]|uniref:Uncharacterized protein n=1 Tax=Mycena metata TaxID=1033252 RepID=A0AAD7J5K8_9AGAR|nr:hypothetical protein B0H16DRAFT_1826177 [Mycena metata]
MDRPRCFNKDKIDLTARRPGLVDAPRKRRSTTQIREEEERNTSLALEQQQAAKESHSASVHRVAAKEDEMHYEDEESRRHAARPDVARSRSPESEQEDGQQEDDTMEDTFEAPPPSAFDSESDGMALGTDDDYGDLEADSDNDRDPDYLEQQSNAGASEDAENEVQVTVDMGSDDEIDSEYEHGVEAAYEQLQLVEKKRHAAKAQKRAAKGKSAAKGTSTKAPKGQIRAKIVDSRAAAPSAAGSATKRKAPGQMEPPPATKRTKPSEIGGLKSNWKNAAGVVPEPRIPLKSQSRSSSRSSHMQTGTSDGDYYGGTVEDDKELQAVVLAPTEGGKSVSHRGGTAKMGITLTAVTADITAPAAPRQRKPKYTNNDLPFLPDERHEQLKIWQSKGLGYLMNWAGSLDDAFAAGASQPDFRATVDDIWAECFPDIPATDAVRGVVCHRDLLPARFVPGAAKSGSAVFEKREKEFQEGAAERAKFVGHELDGMSFVYRDPAQKRGACRSQPVAWMYAYHVRVTEVVPEKDRRKQKCALSLSVVSVERAYRMWKTGNKIKERVERRGKKTAHSFVAAPWGVRARQYLPLINKLSDKKWADIITSADEFNGDGEAAQWDDVDESSEADTRLDIQLSSEEE